MNCRLFVIVFIASILFLSAGSSLYAQASGPCDSNTCGPGYAPVLQTNGSCMCVAQDCKDIEGCVVPPKAVEDCESIEGCNPPQIIKP